MRKYIRKFCQMCERYPLTAFLGTICLLAVCTCVSAEVMTKRANRKQKENITKVITANTEIYQENEILFKRIKKNSDIMIRYSHYLDGHNPEVKRVMFCPECGEGASKDLIKNTIIKHEEVLEEVPETFEQLLKDCKELRSSSNTASSSMFGQSITLQRNLDKLRSTKPRD